MTRYWFVDGSIINAENGVSVGWLSQELNHIFDCVSAIKKTLEAQGCQFYVLSLKSEYNIVLSNPGIMHDGYFYIVENNNIIDSRYGCFCNEECANAVVEVLKGNIK